MQTHQDRVKNVLPIKFSYPNICKLFARTTTTTTTKSNGISFNLGPQDCVKQAH